jgi:hypothetical protein
MRELACQASALFFWHVLVGGRGAITNVDGITAWSYGKNRRALLLRKHG